MANDRVKKIGWFGIPPWIILGSVIILVPILVFWTHENLAREKRFTTDLLLEKGAALIRSFEAGTRTGMMGMMGMQGGRFQLQRLLTETAQQPDIKYLIVTDINGKILAHDDPSRIGEIHGRDLDLGKIFRSNQVQWRQISNTDQTSTFEVFRRFLPTQPNFKRYHQRMMNDLLSQLRINPNISESNMGYIIFVGLDMGPLEEARKEDTRHSVIMALILLLIGFAGIFSLFLAQAYRTTKSSLTKIKAFSDNVVENMPIGLLVMDADGRIASFNQTAESVLQFSFGEIIGRMANEVLPKQLINLTDEIESQKRIIEREIDYPRKDGKRIPLDVSISLLEGEDGAFLGHVILFRDLTEVRNLKREVERSQRLASLGRLAAGIAHEIRNPLSSIKGFATYFRERYKEIPEDQKTAEIMIQEVDRLNRVIGQLLELARPMTIQKRPTSIENVIHHSLKMIEAKATEKGITITTDFSSAIKEISIDPDSIKQVLLNLYLNAIEAMEKGGTLSVEISRDDVSQRTKIAVSDTGIEINKADLAHIFDPYFTTKQSGTGLGLAIVHKIIESHDGEVRVESELGKGTTVKILLPPPQ